MTNPKRPRVSILYHFFHPDDVVSARHFSDLAEGLAERGWEVTARPSNRSCRDDGVAFPRHERWHGVDIRRVWRPAWQQASNLGRLLNALWMLAAWKLAAICGPRGPRDAVIIGTDPVMSVLAAIPWRVFRPRTKIAHWCFDLYPDAAVAEGMLRADSLPVRFLRWCAKIAYRRCDFVADLGPCMASRLKSYEPRLRCETLTPWALVEPEHPPVADLATRAELFGDARLGLLYSGSFGRAHDCDLFLELARKLRSDSVGITFAARGNRIDELRGATIPDDANVRFAGFAPEAELERRLAACDLHLVSLRPEWTGTVVPSKFFGALAAGRGVLFAGSPDSAIARWIVEHRVGWVLTSETLAEVAERLRELAASPAELDALRMRAFEVYKSQFSRSRVLDRWDAVLRELVGA